MQYQANVGQNFLAIVLRLVQIFNKYLTNLHENLYIIISESKEHFFIKAI